VLFRENQHSTVMFCRIDPQLHLLTCHQPTGGFYISTTSVIANAKAGTLGGVLIAENNLSPAFLLSQGAGRPPRYPPPPLGAWSDVVFLQWFNAAQKGSQNGALNRLRSLQYFVRFHVVNPQTHAIIKKVSPVPRRLQWKPEPY
jgi:hypothetical protein